jgi:cbb3-type cytochrome oxidase subunit 3
MLSLAVVWGALKAFLNTRTGQIVVALVLVFIGFMWWLHRHDSRIIADHDRQGVEDVQNRSDAASANRDRIIANPDGVPNDGRCRDCGGSGVP